MQKLIDLHTHTTASDGTDSPKALIEHAKKIGLSAVAITDHDNFDGLIKAQVKADELDIELIKGIELSTKHIEGEVHILGYWIDNAIDYEKLKPMQERLKSFVDQRNEELIKNFAKIGISINLEYMYELLKAAEDKDSTEQKPIESYNGATIHLPYFALALVEKGHAADIRTAFMKYLGAKGLAYAPKENLSQEEAVSLLRQNNAFVSFAHPYLTYARKEKDRKALIAKLKDYGLQGLESYYSTNSKDQTAQSLMYCKEYDIMPTGGSDYHGRIKPHVALGTGMGGLKIDYSILDDIRAYLQK